MKIIGYKYSGIAKHNKILLQTVDGILYFSIEKDNFKRRGYVGDNIDVLIKHGYRKIKPIPFKQGSDIRVTAKGVHIND
jgi:hypothetical protein